MRFPFVLVPRGVYDRMLARERLLEKCMRTIVKMKVHGSFIPRTPAAVADRRGDPRNALLEAIDANPHAQKPAIRRALVSFMDKELRKGKTSPEELASLREMLLHWHKKTVDTGDDTEGDALEMRDDELALAFDESNPRDQQLKASLTRGR